MTAAVAYVDERWTWRVPAVACVCNLLVIGYFKSFGILMISFQEEHDYRQSHLMLVLGMNLAAVALLAPVMQILGEKFTSRALVFAGGLLIFIAMSICSFLPYPAVIILFLGGVAGLGFSCAYTPALCINGLCFRVHRSSAAGITFAGASLGQIVFPLLLNLMTERYSLRGCLLILAAVFSHLCALGLLLPSRILQRDNGSLLLSQGTKPLLSAMPKLGKARCCRPPKLAKLLKVLPYLFTIVLANFGYTNQYSLFALFATEKNVSRKLVTNLVIVQGVTDLVFRLVTGPVADRLSDAGKIRLFAFALVLQGIGALVTSQWPIFEVLFVYSIIYGFTGAIYMTLWTVILNAIVGSHRFTQFLSKFFLSMGISNLMLTSLMSVLQDTTRSVTWCILTTGLAMSLGGFFVLPYSFQRSSASPEVIVALEAAASHAEQKEDL